MTWMLHFNHKYTVMGSIILKMEDSRPREWGEASPFLAVCRRPCHKLPIAGLALSPTRALTSLDSVVAISEYYLEKRQEGAISSGPKPRKAVRDSRTRQAHVDSRIHRNARSPPHPCHAMPVASASHTVPSRQFPSNLHYADPEEPAPLPRTEEKPMPCHDYPTWWLWCPSH